MIIRKCLNCGKEFTTIPAEIRKGGGKFCSRKCAYAFRTIHKTIKCLNCGKEFKQLTFNSKFCSRKCAQQYRSKKLSVAKTCLNCGKTFIVPKHREKTAKFCSKKCQYQYKTGKNNPMWKSDDSIYNRYRKYYTVITDSNGNRVFEHRAIAEKILGRPLSKKEVIHHIGTKYPMNDPRNKSDNRPANLYLFPNNKEHTTYHHHPYPLKSNLI